MGQPLAHGTDAGGVRHLMTDEARTPSRMHAAAGEAPESLRRRLKDATDAPDVESPAAIDLEELHASARERHPADATPKRRWRRRSGRP